MTVGAALSVLAGATTGATVAAEDVVPQWEMIGLERVPGATGINVLAVNDWGVAVGAVYNGAPQVWGMRWDRDGHGEVLAEWTEEFGSPVPTGINNRGEMSGNAVGALVRWDAGDNLTVLSVPPRYDRAQSVGITDGGTVVGSFMEPYGEYDRAVRWEPDGQVVVLGTLPGGNFTRATKVSGSGKVIGVADTASGEVHAVRWNRHGRIIDLGLGTARAVNDHGEVVGETSVGTDPAAWLPVRWDARGRRTFYEVPEGRYATAVAINNRGMAVGHTTVGSPSVPLMWDRTGRMTVMASLPDSSGSSPKAINDRGEVVGITGYRWWSSATYWGRDGSVILLGGNWLSDAQYINRRGDIVGFGTLWRVVR